MSESNVGVAVAKVKRTTDQEFENAIQSSTTYAEAAAKLNVSVGAIGTRLTKWRKAGVVGLGNFKRGGHRKLNVAAINARLAAMASQE